MSPGRRWFPAVLLALLATTGRAESPAILPGEALVYRVGWAIFSGAGEIRLTAGKANFSDGRPAIAITMTTATRGLARALYPFEARATSLFDARNGLLIATSATSQSPDRQTGDAVKFDYTRRVADYQNPFQPETSREIPLPPGNPLDLIQSLIQARRWNLRPGEQRDALVIFGDEFYELTLHAQQVEEVTTALGTFPALVVVPRMEKTPPKGMFRKGSTVRVWITETPEHLPIRFEVDLKVGTGVATLTHYDPPPK